MTGGADGGRTITLGYDAATNRVTQSNDSQAPGTGWGETGTGTRAIGHDARGNVTTLGTMGFVYDLTDQPTVVTGSRNGTDFNNSNYVYDGNPCILRICRHRNWTDFVHFLWRFNWLNANCTKRVKSVINGRVIYNVYSLSGKLMHVHDEHPVDGGDPERTDYITAGGMSIARVRLGQGRYYEHSDHLGSLVAQSYNSGPIANRTRSHIAHLSSIDVEVGQDVSVGERIGTVGNSGNASNRPAHVHWEVRTGPGHRAPTTNPEVWRSVPYIEKRYRGP